MIRRTFLRILAVSGALTVLPIDEAEAGRRRAQGVLAQEPADVRSLQTCTAMYSRGASVRHSAIG